MTGWFPPGHPLFHLADLIQVRHFFAKLERLLCENAQLLRSEQKALVIAHTTLKALL